LLATPGLEQTNTGWRSSSSSIGAAGPNRSVKTRRSVRTC
jgi:hypothetical protein